METLGNTQQSLRQLQKELETYKQICRDYARHDYLVRLLRGGYPDAVTAESTGTQCGITFSGNTFAVLLIHIEDIGTHFLEHNDSSRAGIVFSTVADFLREIFCLRDTVYPIATGYDITGIVCFSESPPYHPHSYADCITSKAETLLALTQRSGISASVVFSKPYHGLSGIQTAYHEAVELDNYRHMMGLDSRILFCEDYTTDKLYQTPSVSELPIILDMIHCIVQKDYLAADQKLSAYTKTVMERHTPTTESYLMQYYGFHYFMFLCMDTMKYQNTASALAPQFRPEYLFRGLSYPEIARRMSHLLHLLTEENGSCSTPGWVNDVFRYLHENFQDVNVNITTIADKFQMNPAYLSRAFRKYTGKNMLTLLNSLRLREAKLLILGGDSMETAARKAGFGSSVTMRRYMKRYGESSSDGLPLQTL